MLWSVFNGRVKKIPNSKKKKSQLTAVRGEIRIFNLAS
jgi:hypothetical protein